MQYTNDSVFPGPGGGEMTNCWLKMSSDIKLPKRQRFAVPAECTCGLSHLTCLSRRLMASYATHPARVSLTLRLTHTLSPLHSFRSHSLRPDSNPSDRSCLTNGLLRPRFRLPLDQSISHERHLPRARACLSQFENNKKKHPLLFLLQCFWASRPAAPGATDQKSTRGPLSRLKLG